MIRRPAAWPELDPRLARAATVDYEDRAARLELDPEQPTPRREAEEVALQMVASLYRTRGVLCEAPR